MEVVLLENSPGLGYVGDVVNVKPGYARNFLLPRGIAQDCNSGTSKQLKHRMAVIAARKAKLKAVALEESKKYEGLILEFSLKIGEKGKSFGSVSLKDIENALKEKGYQLDRSQLSLKEQIKAGGDYSVEITLHSEVKVPVTARVTVERVEKKSDDKKSARKGKSKSKGEAQDENELNVSSETSESSEVKASEPARKKSAKKDEDSPEDQEISGKETDKE